VNPTLLVEVLSRHTEEYDRREKFEHYKRVPSLREYVLVAFDDRAVEVWRRGDDGRWSSGASGAGDVAHLTSIGCTLAVDELYDAALERG
jgi:Uma2 family endonuclease